MEQKNVMQESLPGLFDPIKPAGVSVPAVVAEAWSRLDAARSGARLPLAVDTAGKADRAEAAVDPQEINDPQAVSDYIDRLIADINKQPGEKVFRVTVMADPGKYEGSFYKPLYDLFFAKLLVDFDGAGDFVSRARATLSAGGVQALRTELDDPSGLLFSSFLGIKPNGRTQGVPFDLYSILLFSLTVNLEGYLGHLYDEMIITRPEIAIAREGVSYHTRAESTIFPRDKKILRGRTRSVERYQSIYRGYMRSSRLEDQRSSEHARKIEEGIALWKKKAQEPGYEHLKRRSTRFMEDTVVVEYDSDLPLIIADTERNVARVLQVERQAHAFVFSSAFLDSASPEEIAIWLNFGQEWLDIYGNISSKEEIQEMYEVLEEERAKLNVHFFSIEDSHLMSTGTFKKRIAELMRAHVLKRSQHLMKLIAFNEEKAEDVLRRVGEKMNVDPSRQRDMDFGYLVRGEFLEALGLLRDLLNMYEAVGMHAHAAKIFYEIVYTTAGVQFYDPGGILPHSLQNDLVFMALRLGLWGDFLNELDILFTAKTDVVFYEGTKRPDPLKSIKKEFRDGSPRNGYPRPMYEENIAPMKMLTDSIMLRRKLRTVMAAQLSATPVEKRDEVKGYVEMADIMIKTFLRTRFRNVKAEAFPGDDPVPGSVAGNDDRAETGGIDLTRGRMDIETGREGQNVEFHFDPANAAQREQLQNATGFTPVIIDIAPMTTTVPMFLGISDGLTAFSGGSLSG